MPSENSLDESSKRALELIDGVKATKLVIPIDKQLKVHLEAINHHEFDVTYENAQARIRTNILMDLSNKYGGFVIGPSDLSEIALGFTTYNGDSSSMYGINSGVPKTLVLMILEYLSKEVYLDLEKVIYEVAKAKPSPELLKEQATEDVIGRYDINDFILYHFIKSDWSRDKFIDILPKVFNITSEEAKVYINRFLRRFYQNQFKRNVLPEGPNVLEITLNPRDGFRLAGDNEVDY
jgi:NAD+ synthase (glutamine-hydrolysing)